MSGFLQRLIDRGSGELAPAIAPRLPSAFEPPPRSGVAGLFADPADPAAELPSPVDAMLESVHHRAAREAPNRPAPPEPPAYRGPLTAPDPGRMAPASNRQEVLSGRESTGERPRVENGNRSDATPADPAASAPLVPLPPATVQPKPSVEERTPRQRPVEEAPKLTPSTTIQSIPPNPEPIPHLRGARMELEVAPAAHRAEAPLMPASVWASSQALLPPPPIRPAPVEPRIVRAAATPEPEVFSRRPGGAPADTEPPVIRVSIGRIDVRAITPPPAPPPAPRRRTPAPLGLEEYLQQRMRGER
jgi:hypothetical protein